MIDQVRPSGLTAWFQGQAAGASGPVVLDVREPREVQAASIRAEGFELRAIPMMELPRRLREFDPAQPVACLCHHGVRSQHVAAFLVANGFTQVANIAGGIDAWSQELDARVPRY